MCVYGLGRGDPEIEDCWLSIHASYDAPSLPSSWGSFPIEWSELERSSTVMIDHTHESENDTCIPSDFVPWTFHDHFQSHPFTYACGLNHHQTLWSDRQQTTRAFTKSIKFFGGIDISLNRLRHANSILHLAQATSHCHMLGPRLIQKSTRASARFALFGTGNTQRRPFSSALTVAMAGRS